MFGQLMRRIGGAAPIAVSAGAAGAAAVPYRAPGPASPYAWSGPYVGGNLGYQWGNPTRNPTSPWGIAGGVQGGHNWQTGAFVFGAEADITASAARDTFAPWKFANPWFGTLRGRGAYGFNNILGHATHGFAFVAGEATVGRSSQRKTRFG